jgi:hypothetical protein
MWRDTTSYSRNQERIPTTWSLDIAGLHITVTKGYRGLEDSWIMHCAPWYDTKEIGPSSNSVEWAQAFALDLVRMVVAKIQTALAKSGGAS